jgi:Fe2+ transport system protein FeoA
MTTDFVNVPALSENEELTSLSSLLPGASGKVSHVQGTNAFIVHRLLALGVRPGVVLQRSEKLLMNDPLIFKIGLSGKLALRREEAQCVSVILCVHPCRDSLSPNEEIVSKS